MEINVVIKAACQPKIRKIKYCVGESILHTRFHKKKCNAAYYGESGENMHTRAKSHLSKFSSKSIKIRETSAFFKHIENSHGGLKADEGFEDYYSFEITKAYQKVITRGVEEGTFIVNHKGEVLNSKNEWRQPKIIRTTIQQGGAEMAGGRIATFPLAGNYRSSSASINVTSMTQSLSTDVTSEMQDSAQDEVSNATLPNTRARARQTGSV